jgi:hypothetical protein
MSEPGTCVDYASAYACHDLNRRFVEANHDPSYCFALDGGEKKNVSIHAKKAYFRIRWR